jgi:hypothetical protein
MMVVHIWTVIGDAVHGSWFSSLQDLVLDDPAALMCIHIDNSILIHG